MQISIIIPTYNRASYLKETLDSAMNQDIESYEILVVDDGSTDDTEDVVNAFKAERIRYFYKEHTGAPDTRNLGIKMAKGKYVLWLDSDDYLCRNILSEYTKNITQSPEIDVFFGQLLFMDLHMKKVLFKAHCFDPYLVDGKKLLAKCFVANFVPNGGSMVKKSLYDDHGGYNPFFKKAEDYDFWSRVIGTIKIKRIPKLVQQVRVHKQNLSSTQFSINYSAVVRKKMMERYPLEDLFPNLNLLVSENEYRAICYYYQGNAQFHGGGFEEACSAFEKSVALINVDFVWVALGESLVVLGRYHKAKLAFQKARSLNTKNPFISIYLENFDVLRKGSQFLIYRFILSKQLLLKNRKDKDIYELFSLLKTDTEDKKILELGADLLRNTSWGDNARARHIIDPLADLYSPFAENPNIKLRQSDYLNIPYKKGSMDIITCLNIINHFDNPIGIIQKCKKHLRDDGILLMSFNINLIQFYGRFLPSDLSLDILDQSGMEIAHCVLAPKQAYLINLDLKELGLNVEKESLYSTVYAVLKKTK